MERTRVGREMVSDVAPPPEGASASTIWHLPYEVLVLVFRELDARSLARVAATCSVLYGGKSQPMVPVEDVLRQRIVACGRICPAHLPVGHCAWTVHLAWLEQRRDEARLPVASALHSSVFLTVRGQLFGCGRLVRPTDVPDDVGLEYDAQTPEPLEAMTGMNIACVSAGGAGGVVAVSVTGDVYSWGTCYFATLGHGRAVGNVPMRVQALMGHCVLSVSSGYEHCLAVTEAGAVFSWGWNFHGQCGHGISGVDHLQPRLVEALAGVRPRIVSAGDNHSIVVTECGSVYSFGGGLHGQLGHGIETCSNVPKLVDALRHVHISAASAGFYHTIAVARDGSAFTWGYNAEGQLGHGYIGGCQLLPQMIRTLVNVESVAAGVGYSCAVTSGGELYTWGDGNDGRLGHDNMESLYVPVRVDALRFERVAAVSAGALHTLVATKGGCVFGWGSGIAFGTSAGAVLSPVRLCSGE